MTRIAVPACRRVSLTDRKSSLIITWLSHGSTLSLVPLPWRHPNCFRWFMVTWERGRVVGDAGDRAPIGHACGHVTCVGVYVVERRPPTSRFNFIACADWRRCAINQRVVCIQPQLTQPEHLQQRLQGSVATVLKWGEQNWIQSTIMALHKLCCYFFASWNRKHRKFSRLNMSWWCYLWWCYFEYKTLLAVFHTQNFDLWNKLCNCFSFALPFQDFVFRPT